MKNILILGSTGSIGRNTLDIISSFPDKFKIKGLSAGYNKNELIKQIKIFKPEFVSILNKESAEEIKNLFPSLKVYYGEEGIIELINIPDIDIVVNAIIGSAGLKYTYEIIKAGIDIALANKESIVMAGELLIREAKKSKIKILPIDSEHSALFHLLEDKEKNIIKKVILTASGGPFFEKDIKELKDVTVSDALSHPVWSMGPKITIDSATMMNKGFEVIEAHYLFGIDYDNIEVIIHPESVIHSMVEIIDGEIYAQLSNPDMRYPILNALSYPEKLNTPLPSLDLNKIERLTFREPDLNKFPLLKFSYEVGRKGGNLPAVLSIADDIAVEKFLSGKIKFLEIYDEIKNIVNNIEFVEKPDLEYILNLEKEIKGELKK